MSITDFDQTAFIANLRQFMAKNGITTRQFSKLSGVAWMVIHRAGIGGTELRLSTLKKIERAMESFKP